MKIDLKSGEVCLKDNQPICLRQARGLRVTSTAGTIWITVTGETGDIFLTPGQMHELRSNGLAIIESIGDGRIRLQKPAPLRWAGFHKDSGNDQKSPLTIGKPSASQSSMPPR